MGPYPPVVESCASCKLRRGGILCDLHDPAARAELDRIKVTRTYRPGEILMEEGCMPEVILVIRSGRVKLSAASAEGKKFILNVAQPGEVLGLGSAISGRPAEATAEALEPVETHAVGRLDFLRLMQRHQEVSINAARQLSEVHNRAVQELRILGLSQSVPQKLALLILQWMNDAPPERRNPLKFSLSHEEVAQLLGTARETVSRGLGQLRKKKLIAIRGVNLHVLDEEKLRVFAGQHKP